MAVSLRDNFRASGTTTFVRGGEQGTVSRKRKGDVNTAHGAAAFTAEESTSFYGNLVGLPSNVRLRAPSGGNSTWGSDNSNRPAEATGNDGIHRVPSGSVPSANLSESNIGFQLLKKSGWKEGTGLGATEQGRLDPVETQLKQDRRGIGADLKKKNKVILSSEERRSQRKALRETEDGEKEKVLSKKARKALAKAEREQEHALAAAFYREFWPENV